MTQIRLTKAGKALAVRLRSETGRSAEFQEDVLREYTLKQTGEKVLVNESRIFPKKPEHAKRAA